MDDTSVIVNIGAERSLFFTPGLEPLPDDIFVKSEIGAVNIDASSLKRAPPYRINLLGDLSMWYVGDGQRQIEIERNFGLSDVPFGVLHEGGEGRGKECAVYLHKKYGDAVPVRGGFNVTFCGLFATHRCAASLHLAVLDKERQSVTDVEIPIPAEVPGGPLRDMFFSLDAVMELPEEARFLRISVRVGRRLYGDSSFVFFSPLKALTGIIDERFSEHLTDVFLECCYEARDLYQYETFHGPLLGLACPRTPAPLVYNLIETSASSKSTMLCGESGTVSEALKARIPLTDGFLVFVGVVLFNNTEDEVSRAATNIASACSHAHAELASRLRGLTFCVVFLDNNPASKLDFAKCVAEEQIYLSSKSNLGFGGGHNLLMTQAFVGGAEFYIGLNPDGFPRYDCFTEMMKTALSDGVGMVDAIQFPNEHPKQFDLRSGETDWCSGAAYLLTRPAFEKTAGFDANISMYCEDVDLSWRVRYNGLRCHVSKMATFFHDVTPRIDPFVKRSMLLSALYLARKWGADGFESFSKRQLVAEGFFPDEIYIPEPPTPERIYISRIPEWRQEFFFSLPRWKL